MSQWRKRDSMTKYVGTTALAMLLVVSCGGNGGTSQDCKSFFAIGQAYASLCESPAPGNNILAVCDNEIGQCDSNDAAILRRIATCVGLLQECDDHAATACTSPQKSLSTPCQVAVNVVVAAYKAQGGS